MTEKYKGQEFLENANEATKQIRKINRLICGTGMPEDGCLLGDVEYRIFVMIQIFLAPIVGKEIDDDDLNDMTTRIMSADKEDIGDFIRKYCGSSE